jgi:UDP-N-acetylmuramate: L-alanyl-gamma-D-glutamyl-meso-diaminopimelate ligase
VEADEYDTAFFDKRSKFVHYRPRTLVLNNLEYDHADIFEDLDAIARQFHHLVRTVPGNGRLIVNGADRNLRRVLDMGCWTPVEYFGGTGHGWSAEAAGDAPGTFVVADPEGGSTRFNWRLMAEYNILNATAALAAARHAGVQPGDARRAVESFKSVKRRMEEVARINGIVVLDDFAHHPTAVRGTLSALREAAGGRIICILEPRSNTMRMGVQKDALREALAPADAVFIYQAPEMQWDAHELASESVVVLNDTSAVIEQVSAAARPGDRIIVMSNGDFENLTRRLVERLNR